MVEYTNAYELPTTYREFNEALEVFAAQTSINTSKHQLETALRRINISNEKHNAPAFRQGGITRARDRRYVCATIQSDGIRAKVVKVWTLLPPGGSVLQQLAGV